MCLFAGSPGAVRRRLSTTVASFRPRERVLARSPDIWTLSLLAVAVVRLRAEPSVLGCFLPQLGQRTWYFVSDASSDFSGMKFVLVKKQDMKFAQSRGKANDEAGRTHVHLDLHYLPTLQK